MIQCPSCKASLPDWAQQCQFCKVDTSRVQRPAAAKTSSGKAAYSPMRPAWVWPMYYIVSAYFALDGLRDVLGPLTWGRPKSGELNLSSWFSIVIGCIGIIFGLGLLFKVEIIRGITNILCWLKIISGLFGLAGAIVGTALLSALGGGALGVIFMVLEILNLVSAGFMIYLIGETD